MTEHASSTATAPDFPAHLDREVDRLAALIAEHDVSLPVSTCPGWDLRRLTIHVGNVHRWAARAAASAAAPPSRPADPEEGVNLSSWLRAGADELLEVLHRLDPEEPTWHPFATDASAAVWPRRMAHETALHRVDAELAVGKATTDPAAAVDAVLASDGIDEYFTVMLAGAAQRRGLQLPASSLHVHCTDVHGEWLVWAKGSSVTVQREHAKGDVALRGPASSLLLALWGRPWPQPGFEVLGDAGAAADWLAVGGT